MAFYKCKYCKREDLLASEVVFRYGNVVRYCKDCRNRLQAKYREVRGREQERFYQIKSKYGITKEQYEKLQESQGNKCAVCHQECSSGRELCVDHNHKTNQARGLLCNRCNRVIGLLEEDKELLMQIITYLEFFSLK